MQSSAPNSDNGRPRPLPKVLIVDDAEINRIAFRAVLQDLAQIATAASGEEALRLLQSEDYAVVLLDVMMPGIDGFETLRLMRESGRAEQPPVLFITASSPDDQRVRRGYALGAADYLYKPVLPDALRSKVSVFVELYRQKRALEEQEKLTRQSGVEKLRESEMRLRIAIETAGLGAWDLDLATGNLECTPQCKANFGLPVSLGTWSYSGLQERIHPNDRPGMRASVEKALKERTDYRCEYRVIWPDDSIHHIVACGRALYDPLWTPVRMVGVTMDVTEQRKSEAALRERTEALVRSNTELNQFAYVVSHDLKEPLRMVTSYVQLLARKYQEKLDDSANEFIGYAVEGATRMYALLDDLLEYSRVGTQSATPLKPVDVNQVVGRALADIQPAILSGGAEVAVDLLPVVPGDATQLYQVFQNLLTNSLKFQRAERPKVHVGVKEESDAWRFFVRDNGIGIDPQFHDRIFTLFQRLHTRGEFTGTGVGLSICKKIVERHAGKIWVESEKDHGSTFYFTLPKRAGEIEQPA